MPSPQIDVLKQWFLQHKRSFPWRESSTPYEVWVSEVMLQQTRAVVVIPYFKKWMIRFPTLSSLVEASLEEVFKVWEGLGYYSRAKNLKEGAFELCKAEESIPDTLEKLLKVKGIGPYTAGAILSFAFHQKAAAVDGNVSRVISRYRGIQGDLTTSNAKKRLQEETLTLLPDFEPWITMEALIELGATLCLPNPQCLKCPLKEGCIAHLEGLTDQIPYKKKRKETTVLHHQVVVIVCQSEVLIGIKPQGQVLAGLAEFPSFPYDVHLEIEKEVKKFLDLDAEWKEDLPLERQSFTVYQVELYPAILEVFEKKEVSGFSWYPMDQLERVLTFSSGHKRILKKFLSQDVSARGFLSEKAPCIRLIEE